MSTWPESALVDQRNPVLIEGFLTRRIQESQVTLLGEIDFDAVEDYANTNWSIRKLSNFAFETKVIKQALKQWSTGNCYYPAIIATWAVAQAQNLEDGSELWTTANLETTARTHLARAFSEAIGVLGLETFEDQLGGMQRHMTLARLHAIIPTYALDKYVSHIKKGATYHLSPRLILSDILKAQDMSRAVQKLFEEKSELGLDLIDRSIQTVRHGKDAGLPPRLTIALTQGISQTTFQIATEHLELPIVALDESAGELYLRGKGNWSLVADDFYTEINSDCLPQQTIFAKNIDYEFFTLLDIIDNYLLFNLELEIVDNKTLPNRGGLILFSNKINIDSSILITEPIDFFSWPTWKMAYFQAGQKVQVTLENGVIRNLVPRQSLEIAENYSPHLFTLNGFPIFDKSPTLLKGQVATAINHVTNERVSLGPEESLISNIASGPLDITVYAGLGKSRNLKGLLLPGISLVGDFSPLLKNEVRELGINLPENWTGSKIVQVTYEDLESRTPFEVINPALTVMQIYVDLPKLHWSIEFSGEIPEVLNIDTVFQTNRIKNLHRLVLHGLGEHNPRLIFRQGNAQTVVSGSPRNHDCLYELLVIQDASTKNDARLMVNINGREITLASFKEKPTSPVKRRMVRVLNLSELAATAVQQGVISDEDWNNFEVERRTTAAQLRKSIREKRSQRK